MDRETAIEQMVSDAITQKPIGFSIRYVRRQQESAPERVLKGGRSAGEAVLPTGTKKGSEEGDRGPGQKKNLLARWLPWAGGRTAIKGGVKRSAGIAARGGAKRSAGVAAGAEAGGEVVEEHFLIVPPTLGKLQVISKLYLQLEIDEERLGSEPHTEAMRLCESKTDTVCRIMAVATLDGEKELLDDALIARRAEFFRWHCRPEDFSTCLLAILSQTDYSNFIISTRLLKMFRQNRPNIAGAVRVEQ